MNKSLLVLALFLSFQSMAQRQQIQGVVTSARDGLPLPGVNVVEKGTTNGEPTGINGEYTLTIKGEGRVTLVFSYLGFVTQEIPVTNNQTKLDVALEEDLAELEEVVVVGYGTMKKKDLTGSISSIGEEKLRETVVTSLDQMMQGRLAGVQVAQNSGAPGGATSVRIRGASSVNNTNEPLYIIDGVHMSGEGTEIGGFDWMGGSNGQERVNPLSTIAPSDIVSMDVLKDASATAIYGAAGANGVVIITTRRGEKGAVKLNYDGYMTQQTLAKKLDLMDLREYAQYQIELGEFLQTEVDDAYKDPSILGKGTDWQDAIFRDALMHSHQVSLTGGSEAMQFAASGGYMNQEGTIFGSGFERYNARFNADGEVNKWLKMGGSLAFARTDEVITRQDGNDGVIMQALTMQPSVPIYNFDGTWAGPNNVNGASRFNPVWLATMQNNTLVRNRTMGNFYINARLYKDLEVRTEFGYDLSDNVNKSFLPTYDFGVIKSSQNMMMQREEHTLYWIWKNFATYTHTFGTSHYVQAMAGFEASKNAWENTRLIKQNFSTDDVFVMTADGEYVSNEGYKDESTTASFFGRLNYNFNEKYFFTGTMRADGSSKFGPNNKWGYFPSMALAWRISNENFLKESGTISNLKLRLGYGMVGNSNIGTYKYGSTMKAVAAPWGTFYHMANIKNPNIKWEASEQYNIGLDLGLIDNRINLVVDLYQKETKDLLLQITVPSYLGGSEWNDIQTPYVNIGKTRNRGVDITLNTVNIESPDFRWSSNLIVSVNRNKVIALNEKSQVIYKNLDWYSEFQTATATMIGQPMGVFYGYKVDRLFTDEQDILNAPVQVEDPTNPGQNLYNKKTGVYVGDIKFKDLDPNGVIDVNDQTIIGDPNPDFTFGFTNTFSYKSFDLTIGLTGSYGGDILNFTRARMEAMTSIWDNQAQSVVGRARVVTDGSGNDYLENPGATVPRAATNDFNRNNRMSDRWIEDGSYLRIQNVNLSYTFPRKLTSKMNLHNLKLYTSVQNLYTWTNYSGYDPEIGAYNQSALMQNIDMGRYPSPRMYTIGVNVVF
jgi:TonB-linked SusC/RagA family outer membrane protein